MVHNGPWPDSSLQCVSKKSSRREEKGKEKKDKDLPFKSEGK
jgi:hypothetical protein